MTRKRRAKLQSYELNKAKMWKDPAMVKFFVRCAHLIRPLSDMQWYGLRVVHGFDLVRKIKMDLGVNHD